MKIHILITLVLSLLVLCPVSPNNKDKFIIYYERKPWFVNHGMSQTADLLIERAEEEMQKKDITEREYQSISLTDFEVPSKRIGDIDEDYIYHDCICVILFKNRERTDTLRFSKDISAYHYNRTRIPDSLYVRRIIDYLGKVDKEFYNNTKQAKEIWRNRMSIWNW